MHVRIGITVPPLKPAFPLHTRSSCTHASRPKVVDTTRKNWMMENQQDTSEALVNISEAADVDWTAVDRLSKFNDQLTLSLATSNTRIAKSRHQHGGIAQKYFQITFRQARAPPHQNGLLLDAQVNHVREKHVAIMWTPKVSPQMGSHHGKLDGLNHVGEIMQITFAGNWT